MDDKLRFQRLAALSALLAVVLAVGSAVLSLAAVNGDTQAYLDYSLAAFVPNGAQIFRWSMILDTFGFYLLLTPLALFLWDWLKPAAPSFVRLYTLCGLAYILVGAIGAIVLSAVEPRLIAAYAQAAPARREILDVVFKGFYDTVDRGLWNPLEALLASVWWVGIGLTLRRERSLLGIFTVVLGLSALADAAGRIFEVETLYEVGVGGLFILVPAWALWCGIDLLRRPVPL